MITLLDRLGDDRTVVNAARVSFNKSKSKIDERDIKLLHYLAEHKHTLPFRHPQVSFHCKAPIFLARQLGKHQVGFSWSEVSRRYVSDEPEVYIPKAFHGKPEDKKQGVGELLSDEQQKSLHVTYVAKMSQAIGFYNGLIEGGLAPEEARMFLPQSVMTEWIWTGSLLGWFHVWKLRSGEDAQLLAQDFASELDKEMEKLYPESWKALKEHL